MIEVNRNNKTLPIRMDEYRRTMRALKPGDSFIFAGNDEQKVRHCAWRYFHRKVNGEPISQMKFTILEVENGNNNFECTRIK